MFLQFYGLTEQPFGVTPDPRFLYMGAAQQEALSSLVYGIEMGRGFMALIASPGLGKTTILLQLMERLRDTARTAFLFQTHTDPHEFLRSLLTDLEIEPTGQDLGDLQRQLGEVLIQERQAGRRIVVAIDEAQNLDDQLLETIRTLSNFETPQEKLLQIVLVGQPQLADRLAAPHLEQLRQRISIVTQFPPLQCQDVPKYIDHRLRVAGYQGRGLFTPAALRLIETYSRGVPRNINNVCFQALSLGYAQNEKKIDEQILAEVIADLNLESLGTESQRRQPYLRMKSSGVTEGYARKANIGRPPTAAHSIFGSIPFAPAEDPLLDKVDLGSDSGTVYGVPMGRRTFPSSVPLARKPRHSHAFLWFLALAFLIACLWEGPRAISELRQFAAGGSFGANNGDTTVPQPAPAPAGTPATSDEDPEASDTASPAPSTPSAAPDLEAPATNVEAPPTAPVIRPPVHEVRPLKQGTYMAGRGRLVVESSISGGRITINGRSDPKWTTPRLFSLAAGTYVVTVLKGGYVAWSRRVHVDEGREQLVVANLESADNGIFTVETDPPGMQVFIDGKPYGVSRVETMLKPGWHVCKVIPRPGLQPLTSTFQLRPGEAVTRRIRIANPTSSSRDDPRLPGKSAASLTVASEGGLL